MSQKYKLKLTVLLTLTAFIWFLAACGSTVAVPTTTATTLANSTVQASATPISETPTAPATSNLTSPLPTPSPVLSLDPTIPTYTYNIVNSYPHDPNAFTQGLIYVDGDLYESTGRYGRSNLRKVDLESGRVLQRVDLPPEYFGEGITLFDDRIYKLTWKERQGFIYDLETFELIQEFTYQTEGWGLTHDGQRLIMSDGTAYLYFLDPDSLSEVGRVEVKDGNVPVDQLNELEYINGQVFANIWRSDWIVSIDPASGQVTSRILLEGLLRPEDMTQPVDVLNGIAYDPAQDRLFITGKLWPKLFEIKLVPLEE